MTGSDQPFYLEAATAAYIHSPFCVRKCTYCDFYSLPAQSEQCHRDYCAALVREIKASFIWHQDAGQLPDDGLQTVFFGGGTPSVMPADSLSAVLQALSNTFGLSDQGEFTLEANPGTVTEQDLHQYRQAGFNRISFGLQAIQPDLLERLGRLHDLDDYIRSVEAARQAGFKRISTDIMFGLPGQTLQDVADTVDFLLGQPIGHVSFYALHPEDGTVLGDLCKQHPDLLPDDDLERQQYHLIRDKLAASGFDHYEISNSARPGEMCRHNLIYWQARPYFGFGAAAHSYLAGIRRQNVSDLDRYLDTWSNGAVSPFDAAIVHERLTTHEAMKEMVMLGLRLTNGISKASFRNRFDQDLLMAFAGEVEQLVRRGLVVDDETSVRLTRTGLDFANQVFMAFV